MLVELLERHVADGTTPGAVALVATGDDVEVAVAGLRTSAGAPMQRDTIVRIASMTKPITAAATMLLVEDGTLALDDAVGRWLPEIAEPSVLRTPSSQPDDVLRVERAVTVRDLLTFQSGWGFPVDFSYPVVAIMFEQLGQGPSRLGAPDPDEWMRRLGQIPLMHQPGAGWLYNTGSDILGVLLARASHQSLPDLLAERIFRPLGMTDTAFFVPPDKVDRFSDYAKPNDDATPGWIDDEDPRELTMPAFPAGSGGLMSTVDDYSAFQQMLLAGGSPVLSADSVRLMTTDHTTAAMRESSALFLEGQGWGFGGSVDVDRIDVWNTPGRYGWVGGTGTSAHIIASDDKAAILLTQVEMSSPTPPTIMRDFWTYAAGT